MVCYEEVHSNIHTVHMLIHPLSDSRGHHMRVDIVVVLHRRQNKIQIFVV